MRAKKARICVIELSSPAVGPAAGLEDLWFCITVMARCVYRFYGILYFQSAHSIPQLQAVYFSKVSTSNQCISFAGK